MSTPFPSGHKRAVAMVILRHQDSFLLLKRIKAPYIGNYVPVGGKLEPYEGPCQAALRELREETGLVLTDLRYGGQLTETSPVDYNWWSTIYWATIDKIDPPFCDEGTLEWIPFDQLTTIPTPPTDLQIYKYIVNGQPFALNAIFDEHLNLLRMTEQISGVRFEV